MGRTLILVIGKKKTASGLVATGTHPLAGALGRGEAVRDSPVRDSPVRDSNSRARVGQSRSGRNRCGGARGFSLLELLVTLMVVVLITSLVSLTVSSGGQELRTDAQIRNLANVAQYAMDEAQLQGIDYGLLLLRKLDEDRKPVFGYGWRERDLRGWRSPENDSEIFVEQFFPPDLELRLELDDSPIGAPGMETDDPLAAPQVTFYASGETTPGALELLRRDSGELLWRVEWDLLGRFTLLRRGLPEDDDEAY